jgi:hypothetical protein
VAIALLLLLVSQVIAPMVRRERAVTRSLEARRALAELDACITRYVNNNGGRLPPHTHWARLIGARPELVGCCSKTPGSFAINPSLAGRNTDGLDLEAILITEYDGPEESSVASDMSLIPADRHDGVVWVVRLGGRIDLLDVASVRASLKSAKP